MWKKIKIVTNKNCPVIFKCFLIIGIICLKNSKIKLIKYYNLINHNLIYNNKAINRYKKDNFEISDNKAKKLELLKKTIINQNNCELKKRAKNIVFSDGNPKSKVMLIGEAPVQMRIKKGCLLLVEPEYCLIKC